MNAVGVYVLETDAPDDTSDLRELVDLDDIQFNQLSKHPAER